MAQETIGLPLLLWALEQSHEQLARTARRWWLFTQLAILVSCLMGVASIVWALSDLREAWHTGKWAYFWQTVNGVWAPWQPACEQRRLIVRFHATLMLRARYGRWRFVEMSKMRP